MTHRNFWAMALVLASGLLALATPSLDPSVTPSLPIPKEWRTRNVGGRDGAGLCVFTSIMWAGRWANEPRLWDFQTKMRAELGGGWPEKVDQMLAKYAKGVEYIQDTNADWELLKAAMKSRRMPCVTYCGHDPHYGNETIAHMVDLVAADDERVIVCDNNFPDDYVVLSPQEFRDRWEGKKFLIWNGRSYQPIGGGWAVYLLHPGAPPVPKES